MLRQCVGLVFLIFAVKAQTTKGLPSSPYGHFVGFFDARFEHDGRQVTLLAPLTFIDPELVEWVSPAGSRVDGASIPRWAWSIIGDPFEGKYRDASAIHDVACDMKSRTWESAHRVLYYAMLVNGADPITAKVTYAAVYHFGPRWADPIRPSESVPIDPLRKSDFNKLKRKIVDRETKPANASKILRELSRARAGAGSGPAMIGITGAASASAGAVARDQEMVWPMSIFEIEQYKP
jgi:hypothetical protein